MRWLSKILLCVCVWESNAQRALGVREGLPFETLTDADVRVMSNAYTRTQLSAQALLRGLLGDNELRLAPQVHVLAQERDMINSAWLPGATK